MASPFIGEIRIFPYNFAPRGWASCDGQLLSIAQNTALFSLLGTTYGGNGQTTFALPDLRGRVPLHRGQGPGLSNYTLGEIGGQENVTLTANQLPVHTHALNGTSSGGTHASPAGSMLAREATGVTALYGLPGPSGPEVPMDGRSIGSAGQNIPHQNMQPFLAFNICIALEGIFPSRN